MNTFGYVLASSEGNMEGLVVVANDKKEAISYKSCILAHPSTKITNPNKLKKKSQQAYFWLRNCLLHVGASCASSVSEPIKPAT
jgi:hypothetical protein